MILDTIPFLYLSFFAQAQSQVDSVATLTNSGTATAISSASTPTLFPDGKCFKKNRPKPISQPEILASQPVAQSSSVPTKKKSPMPAMAGDSDGCIALQNQARAAVGVPLMRWDAELAKSAQAWANHLYTYDLGMVHSSGQGQNLYKGSGECKGAFVAWVVEEKPRYALGAPIAQWGNFESYGHYTQIVYRSTNRAGCSIPHANGGYFVCHYMGQQISGTAAF